MEGRNAATSVVCGLGQKEFCEIGTASDISSFASTTSTKAAAVRACSSCFSLAPAASTCARPGACGPCHSPSPLLSHRCAGSRGAGDPYRSHRIVPGSLRALQAQELSCHRHPGAGSAPEPPSILLSAAACQGSRALHPHGHSTARPKEHPHDIELIRSADRRARWRSTRATPLQPLQRRLSGEPML